MEKPVDSLYANSFALMILVLLSLWGFGTSSLNPNGIGMLPSMFVAIVVFLLCVYMRNKLLAYSSVLPGLTAWSWLWLEYLRILHLPTINGI